MKTKTKPVCKVATNGNKFWYLNGKRHREDGPAIEYASGTKRWYLNDKLHREDGPAIEHADGSKEWCLNGKLHREDGPACEYTNGDKCWYLNGKELTEDEFNKTQNKMNHTLKELADIGAGPAFPCPVEYDPNGQRASYGSEGMSLRVWLVGQALAGGCGFGDKAVTSDHLVVEAIKIADDVLKKINL